MTDNNDPELIGLGRTGRVLRVGNTAVKTANIWTLPENASETTIIYREQMNETNRESLKHEGLVYRHLGQVQGVMMPHRVTDAEIRMPYLRQGSLSSYLRPHGDTVDGVQRLQWLREAAHILRRVHERRVLVSDIAARNFLLDEGFSLQMCDFTESVIVSDAEDMATFVSEDFVSSSIKR
jgi:serine/threonine protein kinase